MNIDLDVTWKFFIVYMKILLRLYGVGIVTNTVGTGDLGGWDSSPLLSAYKAC
jgi:hypothetical protein